jgi:hypothetical protein
MGLLAPGRRAEETLRDFGIAPRLNKDVEGP